MEVVPATCESDIPLMNVSVMDDTTDGEYSSPERVAPLREGGGGGGGGVGCNKKETKGKYVQSVTTYVGAIMLHYFNLSVTSEVKGLIIET